MDKLKKLNELSVKSKKIEDKRRQLVNEIEVETNQKNKTEYYKMVAEHDILLRKNSEIKLPFKDKIFELKLEMISATHSNQERIDEIKKILITNCPHDKTEIKTEKISGSYLNTGSITRTLFCLYCNKVLDEKTTDTGYE